MRIGWTVVALAAVALGGCQSPGASEGAVVTEPASSLAEVAVGEPFTLAPGDAARVTGTDLAVRFVGVDGDSRCPVDVTCVWEGDAAVVIETELGEARQSWRLHTPGESVGPRTAGVGGLVLELVGLAPAPRSEAPIGPDAYRATLTARPAAD